MRTVIQQSRNALLICMALLAISGSQTSVGQGHDTTLEKGFKLEVIIYGLVAFVPDNDGKITALMVDDQHHQTIIGLMEGECGGHKECTNGGTSLKWNIREITKGQKSVIVFEGLRDLDRSFGLCKASHPSNIPGDMQPNQTKGMRWIPCMKDISKEYEKIRKSCIGNLDSCKAIARFPLKEAATIGVCHFSHKNSEASVFNRFYYMYDYWRERDGHVQGKEFALADAILVSFQAMSPTVALKVVDAENSNREYAAVTLNPQKGKVTLVVSNNDYRAYREAIEYLTEEHEHFRHYYQLSANYDNLNPSPEDLFIPQVIANTDPQMKNGLKCEIALQNFEGRYLDSYLELSTDEAFTRESYTILNGYHNQRECDFVAFSGVQ